MLPKNLSDMASCGMPGQLVVCSWCKREYYYVIDTSSGRMPRCDSCGSTSYRLPDFNVHYAPYNRMGTMTPVKGYLSGDVVDYGGGIYRPVSGSDLMMMGGHRAHVWRHSGSDVVTFYCS